MLNISGINVAYWDGTERSIAAKIEIFFDGLDEEPLTVFRDDYLIDFSITEEGASESSSPFGAVAANQVSFTLINFNDQFNPINLTGPYFGKIKTQVPIKVWLQPYDPDRPSDAWVPMGVFKVVDWVTAYDSDTVEVTANDEVQILLQTPMPDMEVQVGTTYRNFITYILNKYGYINAEISGLLSTYITYGYFFNDDTQELFQEITTGSMSVLTTNRYGQIAFRHIEARSPSVVLTDDNQLINVTSTQSIVKQYNGVKLTYYGTSTSDFLKVLEIDELEMPVGVYTHPTFKYDVPVRYISGVTLYGESITKTISYDSTIFGIKITTDNQAGEPRTMSCVVTGKRVTTVAKELTDDGYDILEIDNRYIQTDAYAEEYREALTKWVTVYVPELEVVIRGNPQMEIGDTAQVNSERFGINFTGIVKRIVHTYDGGYSSIVTLLNAEVVQ